MTAAIFIPIITGHIPMIYFSLWNNHPRQNGSNDFPAPVYQTPTFHYISKISPCRWFRPKHRHTYPNRVFARYPFPKMKTQLLFLLRAFAIGLSFRFYSGVARSIKPPTSCMIFAGFTSTLDYFENSLTAGCERWNNQRRLQRKFATLKDFGRINEDLGTKFIIVPC